MNKDFKTTLTDILHLFEPVLHCLRLFDSGKSTIGLVQPALRHINETLSKRLHELRKSPGNIATSDVFCIADTWATRSEAIDRPIYEFAYLLNPEYREDAREMFHDLDAELEKLVKDGIQMCLRWTEKDEGSRATVASIWLELDQYFMNTPDVDFKTFKGSYVTWWKTYKNCSLRRIATKLLAAIPTQVVCERAFSHHGLIQLPKRNRLRPAMADATAFCKLNLLQLQRIKTGKPEVFVSELFKRSKVTDIPEKELKQIHEDLFTWVEDYADVALSKKETENRVERKRRKRNRENHEGRLGRQYTTGAKDRKRRRLIASETGSWDSSSESSSDSDSDSEDDSQLSS